MAGGSPAKTSTVCDAVLEKLGLRSAMPVYIGEDPAFRHVSAMSGLDILVTGCRIEKAFLFDVVSKIYLATDSSPVDMQSYELCADMIDVITDVSSIYGGEEAADENASKRLLSTVLGQIAEEHAGFDEAAFWDAVDTMAADVVGLYLPVLRATAAQQKTICLRAAMAAESSTMHQRRQKGRILLIALYSSLPKKALKAASPVSPP